MPCNPMNRYQSASSIFNVLHTEGAYRQSLEHGIVLHDIKLKNEQQFKESKSDPDSRQCRTFSKKEHEYSLGIQTAEVDLS